MFDHKPEPKVKELVDEMQNDIRILAVEMSRGDVNYDHGTIKSLIETAKLLSILEQIRDELRVMNHATRMKRFPASLLNTEEI